jgi:hypothetical protein
MQLNFRRIRKGEPLVLIHGIGSQWQIWGPVVRLDASSPYGGVRVASRQTGSGPGVGRRRRDPSAGGRTVVR